MRGLNTLLSKPLYHQLSQVNEMPLRLLQQADHLTVAEATKSKRIQRKDALFQLAEAHLRIGHQFIKKKIGQITQHNGLRLLRRQKLFEQVTPGVYHMPTVTVGNRRYIDQKIGLHHHRARPVQPRFIYLHIQQIEQHRKANHLPQHLQRWSQIVIALRQIVLYANHLLRLLLTACQQLL